MISALIGHARKHNAEWAIPMQKGDGLKSWQVYFNQSKTLPKLPKKFTPSMEYVERKHQYHEMPFKDGMRLSGYFQSERYFDHCREEVMTALAFPWKMNKGTVAIHKRMGDYKMVPNLLPIVTDHYLTDAVVYFNGLGFNKFLVFSDELESCREFFSTIKCGDGKKYGKPQIDFCQEDNAVKALILMSECEHQVISNSTFSLWSYILNQNPNKICVAPKTWFGANSEHQGVVRTAEDIYPKGCLKF